MIRDTRTAYRRRAAATERSVDAAMAEVEAAAEVERQAAIARYRERTKPVPYDPTQLTKGARVRTHFGWWYVIRVNTKTVTLDGDFDAYRVPFSQILEVKP